MPRRAATVTQADIARMMRAAKSEGLKSYRIAQRPDGTLVFEACEMAESGENRDTASDKSKVVL